MNAVEKYISGFEPHIQERLNTLRQLFFEIIPDTVESMRYSMPAYTVGEHHLYFAAYKNHIGFYPVYGLPQLEEEINAFKAKGTKDSLHFLHKEQLPMSLIRKIIKAKHVNVIK